MKFLWLAGVIVLATSVTYQVDDAIIDEFINWHRPELPPEVLEHPLPDLVVATPGMSSATQALPEGVRMTLLRRFQEVNPDRNTWARRWLEAENELIGSAQTAYDVILALEMLGNEAFTRHLVTSGYLPEPLPEIHGPKALNFFLVSDKRRSERFPELLAESFVESRPRLKLALGEMEMEVSLKGLKREHQLYLASWALDLVDRHRAEGQDVLSEHLAEALHNKRSKFRSVMGFEMPSTDAVVSYLQRLWIVVDPEDDDGE